MNLEARKILFIQEFLQLQNKEIIRSLEDFLEAKKSESIEDKYKPMSLEEFNNEIDKSLEDSQNGNIISSFDLKEKVKKWS